MNYVVHTFITRSCFFDVKSFSSSATQHLSSAGNKIQFFKNILVYFLPTWALEPIESQIILELNTEKSFKLKVKVIDKWLSCNITSCKSDVAEHDPELKRTSYR